MSIIRKDETEPESSWETVDFSDPRWRLDPFGQPMFVTPAVSDEGGNDTVPLRVIPIDPAARYIIVLPETMSMMEADRVGTRLKEWWERPDDKFVVLRAASPGQITFVRLEKELAEGQ